MNPSLQRIWNGLAKVAAGLTPFGESVWPGVRNDLFVAHQSIYLFFASSAAGCRVLDAGCGTGYGSLALAEAGARSVLAIDIDRRNVSFARRHFAHPAVTYIAANLQTYELAPASLDLVVSSNALEHLDSPDRFLQRIGSALQPSGHALLAVPPITSPATAALHEHIHYHRSNLTVDEWLELFQSRGWRVACYAHMYPPGRYSLDFRSPAPSIADPTLFTFEPSDREHLYRADPITAIFSLTRGAT